MASSENQYAASIQGGDRTARRFFAHSDAQRVSTDAVIAKSLTRQYPDLELVIAPQYSSNLLGYAAAGHASYTLLGDDRRNGGPGPGPGGSDLPSSLRWTSYVPPARRIDGDAGYLAETVVFGRFLYRWRSREFVVYLVDGRDGAMAGPRVDNFYVLAPERAQAEALVAAAGRWSAELHGEVWVFDSGMWQKSAELYRSIQGAEWENVILDEEMKKAIIEDHLSFFGSRDRYTRLKVPWKRGVIYYGPPGNGKTISIKAMMHMLYSRKPEIPTLYVRTLTSFFGPEYSIQQIFAKARQFAPCYLVFEDLDTVVSDNVRSYFLNEVDGLKSNDGIFMIGSTNHLDRLDPGISKRPSRFDRKYYFPDPDRPQREAYCRFWQRKLAGSGGDGGGEDGVVEFPDELIPAVAGITHGFSFAYMQEAFVAALLAIARRTPREEEKGDGEEDLCDGWVGVRADGGGDLEGLVLWVEIKKQVAILREGMEEGK